MVEPRTSPTFEQPFELSHVGKSLDAIIPVRMPLLRGLRSGDTTSKYHGSGIEVDGVRDYETSDDPRFIDWRATAKSPDGDPKVRIHQADITPTLWLVTDALRSKYRANAGGFSEQAFALSTLMFFMKTANLQGIPTKVVAVSDFGLYHDKNARTDRTHAFDVGKRLARLAEQPNEAILPFKQRFRKRQKSAEDTFKKEPNTLQAALKMVGQRAVENVVVVISDFRDSLLPDDPNQGWLQPLRTLVRHCNDVTAIELTQPWDSQLPEKANTFMVQHGEDLGIGGKREMIVREEYARLAIVRQQAIAKAFRSLSVAHIGVSTDDPKWFSNLRNQLRELSSNH